MNKLHEKIITGMLEALNAGAIGAHCLFLVRDATAFGDRKPEPCCVMGWAIASADRPPNHYYRYGLGICFGLDDIQGDYLENNEAHKIIELSDNGRLYDAIALLRTVFEECEEGIYPDANREPSTTTRRDE